MRLSMLAITLTLALLAQQPAKIRTGPDIGARIPTFEAPDQNGHPQTLASVAGPKGAVLVFFRSADW